MFSVIMIIAAYATNIDSIIDEVHDDKDGEVQKGWSIIEYSIIKYRPFICCHSEANVIVSDNLNYR